MKVAVVTFPGSNCDYDCFKAVEEAMEVEAIYLWHRATDLEGADAVFLPGGFSYGDYLRAGAIARMSPIMREVRAFADAGGPVAGICNGFQILCEAGMLPGALARNQTLRFISRVAEIRVETIDSPFTSSYGVGERLRIPVAHGEGRYTADTATLAELERGDRVAFRYVDGNLNGSDRDIAGILNPARNVLGMMPHPERAIEPLLGSESGRGLFRSLAAHLGRV